jgi:predicted transcriptional regulator
MENITIIVPDFVHLSAELQAQLTAQLQNYADFLFQKYAAQTATENYASVSEEELEAIDRGLADLENGEEYSHEEAQKIYQQWL